MFSKATIVVGMLAISGTLGNTPHRTPLRRAAHEAATPWGGSHAEPPWHLARKVLMIRVAQETSPGAGDFDTHILGFVQALQTTRRASDFYEYRPAAASYTNAQPVLTPNTSHLFFVNASDGLAVFVVQNKRDFSGSGNGGSAKTRWELSGGTASILKADDDSSEAWASNGGTVFTGDMNWSQVCTDGMVVGALPVGFTILGQFTAPPTGLGGGWQVISADGSKIRLNLVPGQRVRLDVALHVRVRQDH